MVETIKQLKELQMTNDKVFIISVLLATVTLIGTIGFNDYSALKSMERNIESAIVKGIDPVAVRCAYKADSTMCAIYATKSK
jgi:uncharacterized membrane protein